MEINKEKQFGCTKFVKYFFSCQSPLWFSKFTAIVQTSRSLMLDIFCASLFNIWVFFCSNWYCDTVMTAIPQILPLMSVLFTHRCKYNGIWSDCHASERFCAIKPGSIHHFLLLKILVPSQKYYSCCLFVWRVLSFDFAI